MRLVVSRYRPPSLTSLPSLSRVSPPPLPPTLGSKLQVLAAKSPAHLAIIEALADQILARLDSDLAQIV